MIRTLYSEDTGPYTLVVVEITEPELGHPSARSISWEFHCSVCDASLSRLREAEARAEVVHHVHEPRRPA